MRGGGGPRLLLRAQPPAALCQPAAGRALRGADAGSPAGARGGIRPARPRQHVTRRSACGRLRCGPVGRAGRTRVARVRARGHCRQLRLLAKLQARFHPHPLPGLASWLVAGAGPLVSTWRNKNRRDDLEERLRALAGAGQLGPDAGIDRRSWRASPRRSGGGAGRPGAGADRRGAAPPRDRRGRAGRARPQARPGDRRRRWASRRSSPCSASRRWADPVAKAGPKRSRMRLDPGTRRSAVPCFGSGPAMRGAGGSRHADRLAARRPAAGPALLALMLDRAPAATHRRGPCCYSG